MTGACLALIGLPLVIPGLSPAVITVLGFLGRRVT